MYIKRESSFKSPESLFTDTQEFEKTYNEPLPLSHFSFIANITVPGLGSPGSVSCISQVISV